MPNFLTMSFDGELAPSFDLTCIHPGRRPPDGWGIGYYPGGDVYASVLKEPAPPSGSIRSELVRAWEHLESATFLLHIRTARWGRISDADTQPFARSYARRDWTFVHGGSLKSPLDAQPDMRFEPVGSTDTERVFCTLLHRIAARGWRSIGEIDAITLRDWLGELNTLGALTVALSDGQDVCVYADANGEGSAHVWEIAPPYDTLAFGDNDLRVDLTKRGGSRRRGVVVCTEPLATTAGPPANWRTLAPGALLVVRSGMVRMEVLPPAPALTGPDASALPKRLTGAYLHRSAHADPQTLSIEHRTTYRYDRPVERSSHVLRLTPAHDRTQRVISSSIELSVEGQKREYEDVFGNVANKVLLETPYRELTVLSRSSVALSDTDPLAGVLRQRSAIPVVWMPWQRHMLAPYLLPPELPESQLQELVDYAMRFVFRNDGDLIDTLLDLNATIFQDYRYAPGVTTLATTPWDVYAMRAGVCQDFTNLFICLARLLGVPARYVCGYLYTGPKHANQRQGEATHAWVQVYLPELGWRGFDPTNGVVTQTSHVRVAVGRSYIDATPTSGTIFVGGGGEQLEVDVRVKLL